PVLLTTAASLPQGTVEALAALEPEEITVVGGAGVVSEAVREELEGLATTRTVHRVSGADRYATAAELTDGYPPSLPTVYVALGTNYPDALTAAAGAGDE